MVRAILARTKRKTRRVIFVPPRHTGGRRGVRPDPVFNRVSVGEYSPEPEDHRVPRIFGAYFTAPNGADLLVESPHGGVGDIIKVRESYRFGRGYDDVKPRDVPTIAKVHYEADGPAPDWAGKLRPGIFLPEWASRIHLRITSIGAEPVQHISRGDVLLEGVEKCRHCKGYDGGNTGCFCVELFAELWESVNGRRGFGWTVNPYVWDIGFEATTVR